MMILQVAVFSILYPSCLAFQTRAPGRRLQPFQSSKAARTHFTHITTHHAAVDAELPPPLLQGGPHEKALPESPPDLSTKATKPSNVPSVSTILAFAIPAIGVWLCSPLLSMIDTSTVGLFSGTAQQAALNPAIAVTDYSARAMSFLYTGTTNMVATAKEKDSSQAATTFAGALHLSTMVGASLGSILLIFARPLVRSLIGNDTLDPEVLSAAIRYVRIRSIGMPAAAVIGTAQAACLGLQDVKSPLNVIAVAAVVNLVLDLLLVGQPHAWIGGAAGAAWATIASQFFAMGLFLRWLGSRPNPDGKPSSTSNTRWLSRLSILPLPKGRLSSSFSTRGFLAGRLKWKDLLRRPSPDTTDGFRPFVVPVTTTQVGRCSTYIAMGHVVSSSFGTVAMAANQIITSIFYTLIPIADSLSLTAQSFLPAILAKPNGKERATALRETSANLLKVAGLFGVALAAVVACIPTASRLFTTDVAVMTLVRQIVPVLFTIFSLHGVFCGSEGILLGQRDLKFLGRMYAVYFAVVPYLMLRIKWAAKTGVEVGLSSVWNLFLGYQLFRISAWVGRVAWLQIRTNKEASLSVAL